MNTNAVSMSTRNLRALMRKIKEAELRYRVCAARDIVGPGGGVYLAADHELRPRHLSWIEQRNPARRTTPTVVEVIFVREHGSTDDIHTQFDIPMEGEDQKERRQQRAEEVSREVITRGEDVVQAAHKIFQIVENSAHDTGTGGETQHLEGLGRQMLLFSESVAVALGEYLDGNTLIMDLISEYEGAQIVRHGLQAAVFATELESRRATRIAADRAPSGEESGSPTIDREVGLRPDLQQIFLGGFMHDCGLWNESSRNIEGHERVGAHLVSNLTSLGGLAPVLVNMILFHSEAARLANRSGLLKLRLQRGSSQWSGVEYELHKTSEAAQAALKARGTSGDLLTAEESRLVIPVAVAEYYLTHTEGFEAKSRAECIGQLTRFVGSEPYSEYMLALCNSQVEVVAPRRSYVQLEGAIPSLRGSGDSGRVESDLTGVQGGSISHGNDRFSPHLISLYTTGPDGQRREASYVPPQAEILWQRRTPPSSRMYIPAGRYRNDLALEVTGFMSEDTYERILGEYERELRRQMAS